MFHMRSQSRTSSLYSTVLATMRRRRRPGRMEQLKSLGKAVRSRV